MEIHVSQHQLFLLVLVLVNLLSHNGGVIAFHSISLNRSSFPGGFIFGTASSAYQYEGAANEGGRKPCMWDTFTHQHPDKIADRSNGDVAIDSYHRYKEDVSVMKQMGMDAYRFSISWSRILPDGKLSGGVNRVGIQYYNNLINELLSKGIQPFVTLFHWDTPQVLEDKYGGFLSPDIINDFQGFADICFKEFGDRVKHWITLNEPVSYVMGYSGASFAPGRCSQCSHGNSSTEPYLVGHHQLLAHAAAVNLYRGKYKVSQNGKIGITLNSNWMVPYSEHYSDVAATRRALDFMYGWFVSPITYGDYPKSMRYRLKNRLPVFSKKEMILLKGSYDFLGLNYYTSNYVANDYHCKDATDSCAKLLQERAGKSIGPTTGSAWLRVYPQGIWELLNYTKKEYNNPEIFITENGVSEVNNNKLSLKEALADKWRIDYFRSHLQFVHKAIKNGVNVKGYFAWSLFDNFEWNAGYTVRFGINYIDYRHERKRYPKLSAVWFTKFLRGSTTRTKL
ncbi:beta-glucosidase 13-like [Macadamia integrifolia]|uniref:beta-glucosidase 13-like n=1 Tax=Macadamia integrifolia TaxID=60698 RepID=UPI001C528DEB|nr:beta-glucosidase 13-like [Macadamia integrifolia]